MDVTFKGFWSWFLVMDVTDTSDIVCRLKLKKNTAFRTKYVSVYRWKVGEEEITLVDPVAVVID